MLGILHILVWLLPPVALKNKLLRRFGHNVSPTASIGPVLVSGAGRFEIGDGARINPFNVFKSMGLVRLDEQALIASWNWISAAAEFQELDPQAGTLHMQRASKIGSRNYLDCSGTIIIRQYAWVGGNRTFLQTHEPDLVNERQTAGRIIVGHHSLVHSCCVLMKGAYLPDQSVLETNSTLLAGEDRRRGVYAGTPAKWKADTEGKWFDRTTVVIGDTIIDGPMGPQTETSSLTG
ncbi:MAG: hypothetical protein QOH60_491 [Mycobacterium sp.]|jgi:acetyltransferase-like isoleucine patch superfamily enzyme|nr:hypothetical protein [Mycobacterium sp.]